MSVFASRIQGSIFLKRNILLFFLIQVFGFGGFGLRGTILPLLVYQQTGSASDLGFVAAAQFLASALFGVFGGTLSDHFDRRTYLRFANLARTLIFISFALLSAIGKLSFFEIAIGLVLMGMTSTASTEFACLAYLLPENKRGGGAAVFANGDNIAQILGAALGGVLFSSIGASMSIAVVAATYGVTLICSFLIGSLGPDNSKVPATPSVLWNEFCEGLRFMTKSGTVSHALYLGIIFGAVNGSFAVLAVPYAKKMLHASAQETGWLFAAGAIGAIIGMAIAARVGDRITYRRELISVVVTFIASIILLTLVRDHVTEGLIAWAMAVGSISCGSVLIRMWQMRLIPSSIGGRVIGNAGVIGSLLLVGTTTAAGALTQYSGVSVALYAEAIIAILGISVLFLFTKHINYR